MMTTLFLLLIGFSTGWVIKTLSTGTKKAKLHDATGSQLGGYQPTRRDDSSNNIPPRRS